VSFVALPPVLTRFSEFGASHFPASPALTHSGRTLSYAELDGCAKAFAAQLQQRGVRPGERVVIALENSFEYAASLLAVFLCGAVAVPISPDTTAERLHAIRHDCAASQVVLREALARKLGIAESGAPLLLHAHWEQNQTAWFSNTAAADPAADPDPEALAMILYTSGTTGAPKGVMLSHRNLLSNTQAIISYLELTGRDSIVTILPFFYSFGNSVLLTHLATGARVVIENRFAFPNTVVETMQREKPTGFSGVPYSFYVLLNKSTFPERDWSFLRYISQAGGGMRVEAVRQLQRILKDVSIIVMYGQTEAAARLTYLPPARLNEKLGSAGIPIPGVELRIVDERGQTLPPGQVGEVAVRGENIMLGYWNMPEETAAAIRSGWLYTGDMGRLDEDGFLYLVSRKSDFIKSASYRISPGEIEEVLAECAGVADVAAFGVEDDLLGEAIAAAVVMKGEEIHSFDAARLREHCLQRLPFFKVPKFIFQEELIPRTSSGKTQYFLLREKYRSHGSSTHAAS